MANNTLVTGWQDQPDGRGTFDILKTCLGTIFLLCWSSVCPPVPGIASGAWRQFAIKLELFLLAIIGPEFVFMIAIGQLNHAWRAKKEFQRAGHPSWNLRHCFFTNMGGLHVQFADSTLIGPPSFPVDCEQLLYLVRHKYIAMPVLPESDIDDRNKADDLARVLAGLQTVWFTISSFGRLAQGLHLTTLELTTLGFAFLMTACSICWWRKPMVILHPIVIKAKDTRLQTILQEADLPVTGHGLTPLSFINRREWFMSQLWAAYTQLLRNMHMVPGRQAEPTKADRFPSIEYPETDFKWEAIGGPLIPLYTAVFMGAWYYHFPTDIEQTLWRVSSIISVAFGVLGSIVAFAWHHYPVIFGGGSASRQARASSRMEEEQGQRTGGQKWTAQLAEWLRRCNKWFDWMRNPTPDKDPLMTITVRLYIPTTLLCAAYCFSRAFILIEDLIGLRQLPASAYQTVNWGQYSPIL